MMAGVLLTMMMLGHSADGFCMRATRDLAAGMVPSRADLVPSVCPSGSLDPAIRYDRSMRALRLARHLEAGEIIASVPVSLLATVTPGQKLYANVRVGPVAVQREVEALQPAKSGQALLARTDDGHVVRVLYAGEGE